MLSHYLLNCFVLLQTFFPAFSSLFLCQIESLSRSFLSSLGALLLAITFEFWFSVFHFYSIWPLSIPISCSSWVSVYCWPGSPPFPTANSLKLERLWTVGRTTFEVLTLIWWRILSTHTRSFCCCMFYYLPVVLSTGWKDDGSNS